MPQPSISRPEREHRQSAVLRHAQDHHLKRAHRPGFASDEEAAAVYFTVADAPRWCCVCGGEEGTPRAVTHHRKRTLLAWDCAIVCDTDWRVFNEWVWPRLRGRYALSEAFSAYQRWGRILVEHLRVTGPISARDPHRRAEPRRRPSVHPDQETLFGAELGLW